VEIDKSKDDARRAYVGRFNRGWESFHVDDDVSADDVEAEAEAASLRRTRRSVDPRTSYVRHFADRWWNFQRAEDEEDAMFLGVVINVAVRGFGFAIVGGIVWLLTSASRSTQWLAGSGITIVIALLVFLPYRSQAVKPNE
jgi:hypothetical protein